jgi:Zn-dependent protease with chaperone function
MDFFQAQESARRRTALLVGLFAAAVVSIILGVYLAVVVAGGFTVGVTPGFDPVLLAVVAFGTGALIGLGSFFRTAQLRRGGPAVASLLGGRPISPDTTDPNERRLVNVVEEMSIASGTPVPAIFVLDHEESLNAFAAGHSIHDAAVAVTRGTLEKLDRDELQGVIAHEFSHILNGDMRLNIRLMGLLFGILLLTVVGRGFLRSGAWNRRRGGGQAALIGLALILLGYIGVLFGKLIKAAVSRQREFLADAAAVEFTRNPGGIGGALRKIAGHPGGGRIEDHHAEELSHFFFADGVGGAFARAMSTHPPLKERIRRVDPSGAGERAPARSKEAEVRTRQADAPPGDPEPRPGGREATTPERTAASTAASGTGGRGPDLADLDVASPEQLIKVVVGAAALMGSVGSPAPEHLAHARELLARIPEPLRDAAHEPGGAQALVLALLGGAGGPADEARREAASQLELPDPAPLVAALAEVGPEARLPLLDLALPALHGLTAERAAAFRSAVQRVIRSDGEVRPFDFALVHVLWRHLPGGAGRSGEGGRTIRSLKSVRRPLESVLSGVARAGADDEEAAERAFRAGLSALPGGEGEGLALRPSHAADLTRLDEALERLERGSLEVRRAVLEACAAAVLADQEVRTTELELLRAVAECLELPLPPIRVPQPAG